MSAKARITLGHCDAILCMRVIAVSGKPPRFRPEEVCSYKDDFEARNAILPHISNEFFRNHCLSSQQFGAFLAVPSRIGDASHRCNSHHNTPYYFQVI
jgi:hypothetical protein